MLKIYDGEVFAIDLEEFRVNARQVLDSMMRNPDYDRMVFLLKNSGNVIAATNLVGFLKKNIVFKTFSDKGGGICRS